MLGGNHGAVLAWVHGVVAVARGEDFEVCVGGVEFCHTTLELVDLDKIAVVCFVVVEELVDPLALGGGNFGDEGFEHCAGI